MNGLGTKVIKKLRVWKFILKSYSTFLKNIEKLKKLNFIDIIIYISFLKFKIFIVTLYNGVHLI